MAEVDSAESQASNSAANELHEATAGVAESPASPGSAASDRQPAASPATDRDGDGSLIFAAVRRAFALGWNLVELKGRIKAERWEVEQRGMRVASLWRVSLSKIALMHSQVFPLIGTDRTFYAPQEALPKYLFPDADDPDYTQFSLLDARDDNVKLASFKLYDVTRRAINCLALLYVDPNDSLDSDRIRHLQSALVSAVAQEAPGADPKDELTVLVRKFLDAWDGFLREHYYAGGILPNDELESIAYEAGRSMASLSWTITNETLDWERSLPQLRGHMPVPQGNEGLPVARKRAAEDTARDDDVRRVWENTFRQDFIIRLQHDVVALSSKLDEAYLAEKPTGVGAAQPGATDPELPSVSIRAIKQGLEFWRRAVVNTLDAVPDAKKSATTEFPAYVAEYGKRYEWSAGMRLALTKQVNLWRTLICGQQSMKAFSTESVAQKLVNEVWEEIQGGLAADMSQAFRRAEKAAEDIAKEAGEAIESVFSAARGFFWPLAILAVMVVVAVLVLLIGQKPAADAVAPGVGVAGIGAAVAAVLKWFDFSHFKEKTKADFTKNAGNKTASATTETDGGIAERLGNLSHSIATDALSAMKSGFAQVQTELADLNRSVSVAYPLIDYIALERSGASASGKIEPPVSGAKAAPPAGTASIGSVLLLKDIIWTSEERAEEIKAVVRAAFGPVAVLAYSATQNQKKNEK
ncbi:hypothetical protein ACOCG7_34210 (plasmid) [Paraburkholderia sp. DD10]|uniref:hypothetical protein n=1 Tax=Paraburkholderia sp. DD10 TaxID=3409691 RepID=UPI003BA0BB93